MSSDIIANLQQLKNRWLSVVSTHKIGDQLDGDFEPVAWRITYDDGGSIIEADKGAAGYASSCEYKVEPLYAAPQPAQADTTPAAHGVGDGLYYIQDTRGYVGNCVQWWGPERAGYTTRLDEAGKYPKDEALRQAASRSTDVAWPCGVIDKLARPTIDMQDLRQAASAPGDGNG